MRIENIKLVDGHDYPLVPSFILPNPFECGMLIDFYMVPVYIRITQEQQIINDPTTIPNISVAIQPLTEFAGAQTACFAKYKAFQYICTGYSDSRIHCTNISPVTENIQ